MKTTIDIPDGLYAATRRLATRRNTTIRSVVLEALRCRIEAEPAAGNSRLRSLSFHGMGLQDGIEEGNWAQIRSLIYLD